jgi:phage gpG-like protein
MFPAGEQRSIIAGGYTPADYRVRVINEVVYAPINNWGGEIDVTVTDRMRRFAWAKFYKASGKRKKTGTGQKKRVKRRSKPKELNPQAQFWRNMALTQKKKLHIRIPQRQFMGESEELNRRIREKVDQEITNILNQ